jgi:hypothetical protein
VGVGPSSVLEHAIRSEQTHDSIKRIRIRIASGREFADRNGFFPDVIGHAKFRHDVSTPRRHGGRSKLPNRFMR